MPRRLALPAVLLVAAAACTGGGDPEDVRPDPDAALRDARARLATLARATADASYDAEYRFLQLPSRTTGTIRIRQRPPQYRIDIASKGGATFFALTTGVVSCSTEKKPTCFLVAKPGAPVPGIFDPGVQRLFRDAVEDLADNPGDYLVRPTVPPPPASAPESGTPSGPGAPSESGSPSEPGSPSESGSPSASASPSESASAGPAGLNDECFLVERAATSTPDPDQPVGFENGTYCFAEPGVATSITVASGSLTLVRLRGEPPPAAFKPPAKVRTLPEVSRTPTPTPTAKK